MKTGGDSDLGSALGGGVGHQYPYNVTSFQDLLIYNNTVTNNMFGLSILVIVFFISFFTMLKFGSKVSFASSMWLTTVVSVFLWILQLVNPDIMVVLTVITALSTVFLFRTREN